MYNQLLTVILISLLKNYQITVFPIQYYKCYLQPASRFR